MTMQQPPNDTPPRLVELRGASGKLYGMLDLSRCEQNAIMGVAEKRWKEWKFILRAISVTKGLPRRVRLVVSHINTNAKTEDDWVGAEYSSRIWERIRDSGSTKTIGEANGLAPS